MHRKLGFTLIELLVVIAIITILASIVVPRVTDWIARARMTRAVSEINGAELALTQMLADAERQNLRQIFSEFPDAVTLGNLETAVELYTDVFYRLLRQGRNIDRDVDGYIANNLGANIRIHEEVRANLASSYMDLGEDPWGNLYRIWPGPWNRQMERAYGPEGGTADPFNYDYEPAGSQRIAPPFRSYREGVEDDVVGLFVPYIYSRVAPDGQGGQIDRKAQADARVPGNPREDARPGFPAPADLPVYIYSVGVDEQSNQNYRLPRDVNWPEFPWSDPPEFQMDIERVGGGDDINNWDNQQGWSRFYTN